MKAALRVRVLPMWPVRSTPSRYRVAVGLVASRQLARLSPALASQVRQELHAVAERAAALVAAEGRGAGEPLTLRLPVDRCVAVVELDATQGVVTLRDIDGAG